MFGTFYLKLFARINWKQTLKIKEETATFSEDGYFFFIFFKYDLSLQSIK